MNNIFYAISLAQWLNVYTFSFLFTRGKQFQFIDFHG